MLYSTKKILDINIGSTVINRTKLYLLPTLNLYDSGFHSRMKLLNICFSSIGSCLNKDTIQNENTIYLTVDTHGVYKEGYGYIDPHRGRNIFLSTLSFLKKHSSFISAEPYESNIGNHFFTLELKIPTLLRDTDLKSKFIKGEYSKLIPSNIRDKVYAKIYRVGTVEKLNPIYRIVNKDKEYIKVFNNKLKEDFDFTEGVNDDRELDYPPYMSNEVLHYDPLFFDNEFLNKNLEECLKKLD